MCIANVWKYRKKNTKYINNDKQKPPQPPIILLFCGSFIGISYHQSLHHYIEMEFFCVLQQKRNKVGHICVEDFGCGLCIEN